MLYFAYGFTGLCLSLMIYSIIKELINKKNDK